MKNEKLDNNLEKHKKGFEERKALAREALGLGRDPLVKIWKKGKKKKLEVQHD
ncbi:hypothetical protein TWF506_001402 [Arthrobotrys conoides]|uniref:Uncharacterized protein n=1 Tax=Arthrobotrys conoides TaxID=74498 RepID=A0AAN8S551_9PEZI